VDLLNQNILTRNTSSLVEFIMFFAMAAVLLCKLLCKFYSSWKIG
jgi:hypothetical protein